MSKKYVFRDSVRVYDNGDNEIRLRMGVFNYEEVTLDLSALSNSLAAGIREIFKKCQTKDGYEGLKVEELYVDHYEKEIAESIIKELYETNYLVMADEQRLAQEVSLSLLGFLDKEELNDRKDVAQAQLIFYSDDQYTIDMAKKLSADLELNMDILPDVEMQAIRQADLTSNLDGLSTIQDINYFGEKLKKYGAIIICVKNISVTMMRNINRISVNFEIPVIFTFVDGPVVGALATNPYATGCLECFELRALARLEDHVQFHNFVSKEKECQMRGKQNSAGMIPLLNMIVNLAISEAFTLQHIGASKLTGRLLTIYIPTMEIQAQDILRVPYCPACGAIAKVNLEEKNVSSRALVDEMVKNVLMM